MADKIESGGSNSEPCFCIGRQNGEPYCPCMMRELKNFVDKVERGELAIEQTFIDSFKAKLISPNGP